VHVIVDEQFCFLIVTYLYTVIKKVWTMLTNSFDLQFVANLQELQVSHVIHFLNRTMGGDHAQIDHFPFIGS